MLNDEALLGHGELKYFSLYITLVPAPDCLAFVPSALVLDARPYPSALMQKGPFSQPPSKPSTQSRLPWVMRVGLYVRSSYRLKAVYEAVDPGEHCWPAIHFLFLLPTPRPPQA